MKVPLVSFRSNDHTKACFKRRAFAMPNSVNKLCKCMCLSVLTLLRVIATFSLS